MEKCDFIKVALLCIINASVHESRFYDQIQVHFPDISLSFT